MKIRVHKGGFSESMETLTEIEPTREAIAQYLRDQWGGLGYGVEAKNIELEAYGYNDRKFAEIYIVLLDGRAVAFTDGPLSDTTI